MERTTEMRNPTTIGPASWRGHGRTLLGLLLCLGAVAGGPAPAAEPPTTQAESGTGRLRYFGYYGWYPDDLAASDFYARAGAFANLVVVRVPVMDVSTCQACEAAAWRASNGMHTAFDLSDLLYADNGPAYRPAEETASLFAAWWRANGSAADPRTVPALYPADEAVLRCSDPTSAGFDDLEACLQPFYAFVRLVHRAAPDIPLAVSIGRTEMPMMPADYLRTLEGLGVLWIGYHDYGVADPLRDPVLRANVAALKVDLAPGQELVLVGDAFSSGLPPGRYGYVAWADYQLACREGAVALVEFAWPNWVESGTPLQGAVELPASVLGVHRCIGLRILAGNRSCAGCWPRPPARRLYADPGRRPYG
jgi:hypothetical protein